MTRGFLEFPQPSHAFPSPAETNLTVSKLTQVLLLSGSFSQAEPLQNMPQGHLYPLLTHLQQLFIYSPSGEQQELHICALIPPASHHHFSSEPKSILQSTAL